MLNRPGLDQILKNEIAALTGGRGADIVIDNVGGSIFDACIRALAWCGRLIVIGFASSEAFDTQDDIDVTQVNDALSARLDPALPYIEAEVVHAVEAEHACTIADVLIRRLHVAYELRDHGRGIAPRVAALMAPRLGWTDRGVEIARADYEDAIARIFTIDP